MIPRNKRPWSPLNPHGTYYHQDAEPENANRLLEYQLGATEGDELDEDEF